MAATFAPRSADAEIAVLGSRAITYTPLSSPTVLSTDVDDGQFDVTIPFPVRFYENTYTSLSMGANGAVIFPSGNSVSLSNSAPGSTSSPNNFIAPMWDDLRLYPANGGRIGYQTIGTAPNRRFVIEWDTISRFSYSTMTFSMQIHFLEGNIMDFEIHYGPVTGTGIFTATMGMENSAGALPFLFAASGCTTSCTQTDLTALSGTAVTVQSGPAPSLTGSFATAPTSLPQGGAVNVTVTLTNFGTNDATGVVSNVYLSQDAAFDPTDTLVGSSTTTVPFGDTDVPVTLTIPASAPAGQSFLLLVVDVSDDFVEDVETDNIAANGVTVGSDIVASSVAVTNGAAGINGGAPIQFEVDITQAGFPFAGTVDATFYASSDVFFDMADPVIVTVPLTLTGAAETIMAQGTMPVLPPGAYYVIVHIDPMNVVVETDDNNNFATTSFTFDTGPDFVVDTVTIPRGLAPGTSGTVATKIDNVAVPFTGPVEYTLYLSDDTAIDAMDTTLGTYTVNFAGQSNRIDTQPLTLPVNAPLGYRYVIAEVDPNGSIVEASETNNVQVSSNPVANAVDFAAALATSSPSTVEVGDDVTVTAEISSLGVSFVGNVPFQVYLSADPVYDPADTAVYRGFVFFPGGNGSGQIDVTFPLRALPGQQGLLAGGFTVFVVVDPDNTTLEADETNNAGQASNITIQGADLVVTNITGNATAFIGLPYEVTIAVSNVGVADARAFRYAYYLSDNDIIRVTDRRVFLSSTATIASGDSDTFTDTFNLPTFTSTRTQYLGVIVDIFSVVPETSETNNARRIAHPIEVVFPIPDLRAEIVGTATAAAAGEDISVTRILENIGVAPASNFEYAYYLSSNPQIATDDILIGTFTASLGTGEDDYGVDTMMIPPSVREGSYYIGLIVDPNDLVDEVDDTLESNSARGPLIPVFRSTLQFVTDTLPPGTVGVEYESAVYATGGPLPTTWAVSNGSLPPGITLDTQSGILSGTPTTEGSFEFTLRALSGTAFADRTFSVRITSPTVDLTIASPSLPSGIIGRTYRAQLIAVGGTVPYRWSSVSGLPTGLSLSESGVLSGTPVTPGNFAVSVNVRDDVGNTASKTLALNVTNANQTIQIVQVALPEAEVGEDFCDQQPVRFEAMNGVAPYSWSVVGDAPPGMSVDSNGELCGVPTQVGEFGFIVRAQDSTGLFDTSLFVLEVTDGDDLAVSTFTLENGTVGVEYTTDLTAIRGTQPYTWSVVTEWGPIAPGLTLDESGFLSGTPTADGTFAFVVRVVDAAGRVDIQPLTLTVEPAPVVEPPDDGCSCAATETSSDSPWASVMVFFGLGGLVGLRRRKRIAALFAMAMVVTTTSVATAQSTCPAPELAVSEQPNTLVNLSNPVTITTASDDGTFGVTLPFPFSFFGTNQTQVTVSANGMLAFPPTTSVSFINQALGTTTPNAFIAPYWDDLDLNTGANNLIGYQVEGTAPNRTITFEWKNINHHSYSGLTMNFQVRLFEGALGRFEIDYGTITGSGSPSASMGVEDYSGTTVIPINRPDCSPSCGIADFPQNTRFVVSRGPEIAAAGIDAPGIAFLGAQANVPVSVCTPYTAPIGTFTVDVIASMSQNMTNPVVIGSGQTSLAASGFNTFDVVTTIPTSFGQNPIYLGMVADARNVIAEIDETNNTAVATHPTRLVVGLPDLAVQRVRVSSQRVNAGESFEVYTRVQNVGGEPAQNVDVAVMLSTNPVISRQDVQLETFTVSLAPGEVFNATTAVTLDSMTNSGTYYIGAFADIGATIDELSESNNGRADDRTVTVIGGALAVLTTRLPAAYIGVSYGGQLTAAGGDQGDRTWEVTSGVLPMGISLLGRTGEFFGRPTMAESQTFTVTVTSGSETATRELTLTVVDPQEPLTIVTRSLAAAVVGQEYVFPLVATGGGSTTSSRAWSAEGLPEGFEIDAVGALIGTPMEAGSSTVTISVTDGDATASRELLLEVRDNANLLIVPRVLSTARFNEEYSEQITATGGNGAITFIKGSAGQLPPGLTLSPDGRISGTPTVVGRYTFAIDARDSGVGPQAATDRNTFEIIVLDTEGFTISTASLPEGVLNEGYDATIEASGGLAPYTWTITEGRLPEGLLAQSNNDGTFQIRGQPTEPGLTSLLVQVRDSQGRTAVRAFALVVAETPPVVEEPVDEGGCTCVAATRTSGPVGLGFVFVALGALLVVRRRR